MASTFMRRHARCTSDCAILKIKKAHVDEKVEELTKTKTINKKKIDKLKKKVEELKKELKTLISTGEGASSVVA